MILARRQTFAASTDPGARRRMGESFRCWYPDLRSKTEPKAAEGDLPPPNLTLPDTTRDSRILLNHFFMAWRRSGPDTCASLREDFSLCSRVAAACAWHSKHAGQRRSRATLLGRVAI